MLTGVVTAGSARFPIYRIFIVIVGALLWLALDRTRVGAKSASARTCTLNRSTTLTCG